QQRRRPQRADLHLQVAGAAQVTPQRVQANAEVALHQPPGQRLGRQLQVGEDLVERLAGVDALRDELFLQGADLSHKSPLDQPWPISGKGSGLNGASASVAAARSNRK